jgi:hypothetical protein
MSRHDTEAVSAPILKAILLGLTKIPARVRNHISCQRSKHYRRKKRSFQKIAMAMIRAASKTKAQITPRAHPNLFSP